MDISLSGLLLPCVLLAIVVLVFLTEIIKKLDYKNKLKGKMVFVPLVLSLLFSLALAFGDFYSYKQAPFYAAVVFSISVTFYEAILKKFNVDKVDEDKTEKDF